MKNIHVLPTDKPSTICKNNNVLVLSKIGIITNNTKSLICQNIYITSDEEIKEGVNEWYLDKFINKPRNSSGSQYSEKQDVIILTSDQDLIKDGVQAIDDTFLEWFVKNPSCEKVYTSVMKTRPRGSNDEWKVTYGINIPKEDSKQETFLGKTISKKDADKDSFEDVTKYKIKKGYSEKEVLAFGKFCIGKVADFLNGKGDQTDGQKHSMKELFNEFKNK